MLKSILAVFSSLPQISSDFGFFPQIYLQNVFKGFGLAPPQLIGGEKLSSADKLSLKSRILDRRKASSTLDPGESEGVSPSDNQSAATIFPSLAQCSERNDSPLVPATLPSAVCGIDYLSATGWVSEASQIFTVAGQELEQEIPSLPKTLAYLQELISSFWADSADFLDEDAYSIRGYNRAISYYSGRIKICWAANGDDTPKLHQRCYFSVTGSLLEQLDFHKQTDLLKSLFIDFGFNATRLDTYIRDFNYLVLPKQLKAWADDACLCRFRHKNFTYIEAGIQGEEGATFNAGRRTKNGVSGDCLYRCYDETVEPRSPTPAIKHEVQWSGQKVKNLVNRFAEIILNYCDPLTGQMDETAFTDFCLESTIGAGVIDFREGDHSDTLDSRKRVPEWAVFVEGISKIRIQGKVKKPEINAFPISAFIHQWGRKLAIESNKDARYLVETFLNTISSNLSDIISKAVKSGEEKINTRKAQRLFNHVLV